MTVPSEKRPSDPAGMTIPGELVPVAGSFQGRTYDPFPPATPAPGAPMVYPGSFLPPPPPVMILPAPKSVGVAFVLTFFFGAFGMFYSTVTGALVMLGIGFVVAFLGALLSLVTVGFGLLLAIPAWLLVWPGCIVWGCVAASNHNARLQTQAVHAQQAAWQATGMPRARTW